MRHIATASLLALLFVHAVWAQKDVQAVPVTKASYHLPVFKNEYVTMVNIFIPPGGHTGYHIHTERACQ